MSQGGLDLYLPVGLSETSANAHRKTRTSAFLFAAILLLPVSTARGETVSALYSKGYSVIPGPQKVTLTGDDFVLSDGWQVELGRGVPGENVAVESLVEDLAARYRLKATVGGSKIPRPGVIRLEIAPESVSIGESADRNKAALAEQAYRLVLKPQSISITANAAPGLFYGVETLVQLVRRQGDRYGLPQGEIVDWPGLELRVIYWDDAHHLDHLDGLKRAIRRAAAREFRVLFPLSLRAKPRFEAVPFLDNRRIPPQQWRTETYGRRRRSAFDRCPL